MTAPEVQDKRAHSPGRWRSVPPSLRRSGCIVSTPYVRPVPVSVRCKPYDELQHCLDVITDGAPGVDRYLYNSCIPSHRVIPGTALYSAFPAHPVVVQNDPSQLSLSPAAVMPSKLTVSMRSFRHHLNQPDSWRYLLRVHPGSLTRLLLSSTVLQCTSHPSPLQSTRD